MPSSDSDRIAVLIDADNTSPKHAGALMQEVAKYGSATVKRAYGDWTTQQLAGWKNTLNQLAVQPMQQFAYTTGKNSTDSALIIDAMDLLYSQNVDTFAIVSSDSDFTRLATRLRESGRTVIGFGLRKTPRSLVSACDRFVYLELLESGEPEQAPETVDHDAGQAPATLPDLRRLLTSAIETASHDDGWASLSSVANHVNRNNPSFDVRAYGESKLANLARAQAWLDVEQVDNGVRVRISDGRPAREAAPESTKAPAKKTTRKATSSRSRSKATEPAETAVPPTDDVAVAVEPTAVAEPPETAAPVEQPVTRTTTRTRSRKTAARAVAEPVGEPAPEPTPEPEPVIDPAPPKVVTRTRSRKS